MRQFGKNQSSGLDLWRTAEQQIASNNAEIMHQARLEFVRVLLRRGEASTDDIRSKIPVPNGIDPRFFGSVPAVFARRKMIAGGVYVRGSRSVSHARAIQVWRLIDRQAACDWLDRNSVAGKFQERTETVTPAPDKSGDRIDFDL